MEDAGREKLRWEAVEAVRRENGDLAAKLDNIFVGNLHLGELAKPGDDDQLVICAIIIKTAFKVSCTPIFARLRQGQSPRWHYVTGATTERES